MGEKTEQIIALLDDKKIEYRMVTHPAVYNIAEMERTGMEDFDCVAKNLFVRDEKKCDYFLVVLRHEKKADLKALAVKLNKKRLSFASESDLNTMLSLTGGSVTPFGLINDAQGRVCMVLDSDFASDDIIGVHPNENTATLFLKVSDLTYFLKQYAREITVLQL